MLIGVFKYEVTLGGVKSPQSTRCSSDRYLRTGILALDLIGIRDFFSMSLSSYTVIYK